MLRTPTMLRIALVCLLPLWAAWAEESSVHPAQSNQDNAALTGTVPRLVPRLHGAGLSPCFCLPVAM